MLADPDERNPRAASIRLLAAATEEFARRGFANARIRRIAGAADVSPAAANYYFGSKKGLYRATLMHLAERLEPLDAEGYAASGSPCPMHRSVLTMLNRFAGSADAVPLAKIIAHEVLTPSGQLDSILDDAMGSELSMLRSAVGEVTSDIDSEAQKAAAREILGKCALCLFAGATVDGSGEATFEIDADACEILATQISLLAVGALKRRRGGPR